MEQTFDDISGESRKAWSVTLRISLDTGIGIVKERILHMSRRSLTRKKSSKYSAAIGLLCFLPGALLLSMLMLNIEPSLGFLQPYLQPVDDGPHILGSLIALTFILVLPTIGVLISSVYSERKGLRSTYSNLGPAAIAGALCVLPFIVLELTFGQASYSSFPSGLFGILWILPSMLALISLPIVRAVRSGNGILLSPSTTLLRVAFLILIAVFWIGLLKDQMPCFLGVPNCD